MKKLLVYIVILVFIVNCTNISAVSWEASMNTTPLTVDVDLIGEFETFFGDFEHTSNQQRSCSSSAGEATVTYELTINEDQPTKGFVVMSIDAVINGKDCTFDLSGPAEGMVLTNDVYWSCPLEGTMSVSGTTYTNVLSYMNKLQSDDSFVVTITPPAQTPTHLRIGELLIPSEKFYEIQSKMVTQDSRMQNENIISDVFAASQNNVTDIYQPIPGSIFSIIGNAFTHYSYQSMPQYYSQRARAYYAQGYDRLAVSLKTYCSELENYLRNSMAFTDHYCVTGIERINISLARASGYDHSYIVGTEALPYPFNQSYFSGENLISAMFCDVLSFFGVPTETLSYMFSNAKGAFNLNVNTNSASIDMTSPTYQYINFDSLDYGMPIIFQLATSQYGNSDTYIYSTNAVYKTQVTYPVYEPATGMIQYGSYIEAYYAGTASGTVSIYI